MLRAPNALPGNTVRGKLLNGRALAPPHTSFLHPTTLDRARDFPSCRRAGTSLKVDVVNRGFRRWIKSRTIARGGPVRSGVRHYVLQETQGSNECLGNPGVVRRSGTCRGPDISPL